jgi:hypothetical protein
VKLRELDIVMASSIHACKYEALAGSWGNSKSYGVALIYNAS